MVWAQEERFLLTGALPARGRRSFGGTNPSLVVFAARIDASNARHFVGVAQRRRGPPLFLWGGWCP
jgi:hypothetical protein